MARRHVRGCRFVLAALLVLLVSFPFLEEMARPTLLVAVVAVVFTAAVIAVDAGRTRVGNAITIAVVQITVTVVGAGLTPGSRAYQCAAGLALAATAVLIVYCIYCVLRYLLQSFSITRDQLYAGISVYLMLGFAFGSVYYLVSTLKPDCFAVNSAKLAADANPDLMYFSFVTLATLGYGDITPVAHVTRALAELEAMVGMLYIAVFMARLVTLVESAGSGRFSPKAQSYEETEAGTRPNSGEHSVR
jgi:hypothetical protein